MDTQDIRIEHYTYTLPEDKIAKYPLEERSDSKLLIYHDGISEDKFCRIPFILPPYSLLLFNNTKVIQARMIFEKETGAKIEVFCLEPLEPADISMAFEAKQKSVWKCIVGNAKKWKEGELHKSIIWGDSTVHLHISKRETLDDTQIIEFNWDNKELTFGDLLDAMGKTPIPPYLNRQPELSDTLRYQTIYSNHKGSVAAPTAGLHFTEDILKQLEYRQIQTGHVTLHVGAGTFKPVKTECIGKHEMHIEHFFVKHDVLDLIVKYQGNITSTGTTTVRTLESMYWLGVKMLEGDTELYIKQWDAYSLPKHHSLNAAIGKLKSYLTENDITTLESYTGILIAPGYEFRVVDRLITNFHQPNSTLLLLVAAFTKGEAWKEIYDYALNNEFRFLSYGDSSLLYKGV